MEYYPIDRLNIDDAVRHLEEAQRNKNADHILYATAVLQERLALIKHSNLPLYTKYSHRLEGNEDD